MVGRTVCIAIPYRNFKEKMAITKEYQNYNVEIHENFILVINKNKTGGFSNE